MSNFISILESYMTPVSVVLLLIAVIIAVYNKIEYLCLKKACEKIVEVESNIKLSGEEKFNLVTEWISNSLPKIFMISIFKSIIEKLVQFAYDNSFAYMSKYIKRKTGLDISEVIEELKNADNSISDES